MKSALKSLRRKTSAADWLVSSLRSGSSPYFFHSEIEPPAQKESQQNRFAFSDIHSLCLAAACPIHHLARYIDNLRLSAGPGERRFNNAVPMINDRCIGRAAQPPQN
jgi:hypothetical protein